MTPIRKQPAGARDRLARGRRDASLVRVSSVTKTIGVGIVAAVGVLGLYVSRALPGHHTSAPAGQAPASSPSAPSGSAAQGAPAASPSALTPPASAPARTQAPAPVTSGAS